MLLFFSIQVFPVLEISKALTKKQVAEQAEEFETCGDDFCADAKEEDAEQQLTVAANEVRTRQYNNTIATALQNAERLPQYFIPDILTPPPNIA